MQILRVYKCKITVNEKVMNLKKTLKNNLLHSPRYSYLKMKINFNSTNIFKENIPLYKSFFYQDLLLNYKFHKNSKQFKICDTEGKLMIKLKSCYITNKKNS